MKRKISSTPETRKRGAQLARKRKSPTAPAGRVMTKKEVRAFFHSCDVLHGPYWEIQKALKDLRGYDAMQKMTKIFPRLEKKWPGRVMEACVDGRLQRRRTTLLHHA